MKKAKPSKWQTDTPLIGFICKYAVYKKGNGGSLCYTINKERAEYIADKLNKLERLEDKIKKDRYKNKLLQNKKS